jgi:hypothetical protein
MTAHAAQTTHAVLQPFGISLGAPCTALEYQLL